MAYKELEVDNLIEIDSISSFISNIKGLKESSNGASTEFYFRGQDAEFWDIEPSVFRNDMLSVEHRLMQIPLQKIPTEFNGFNTMFDIMTKYQHYGMCTRLLDLTTNPLVALYFACKCHGNESYISEAGEESHEPYGVIYFTKNYYPSSPTDKAVQIISALANFDLSRENTVSDVLSKLKYDHIIDEETQNNWLQENGFKEFVKIVQSNYMVIPTYTNERLRRQSGVFLLASLFSISDGDDIGNSIISKSRGDLRSEFEDVFFFIRGENKEEILKELDLYNINEATLFPELEHQLNYIKYINTGNTRIVTDFSKYGEHLKISNRTLVLNDDELNNYIISNLSKILNGVIKPDELDDLKDIIQNNFAVDWYNRSTIISKMRMDISSYYILKCKDKKMVKETAIQISNLLNKAVKDYVETKSKWSED